MLEFDEIGFSIPFHLTIGVFCSPVARGFLAGQYQDNVPNDWRASVPYMSGDNLKENSALVKEIEAIASKKEITLAQLSLAWVINQGHDVFPIPGTTKLNHLEDNIKASEIILTAEEMDLIADAAAKMKGERGDERYMQMAYNSQQSK